jgi:hypothetical protein
MLESESNTMRSFPFRRPGAMRASACATVAALAMLAGCQKTPALPMMTPIEIGGNFGYADKPTGDNQFEVTYQTPLRPTAFDENRRQDDADRTTKLAKDLALWRAAELTLSRGFPAFRVVDVRNDVKIDSRDQTTNPPYYAAPLSPFFPPLVTGPQRPVYPYGFSDTPVDYRSMYLQAKVTLSVTLQREASNDFEDAAAVARQMRSKYPTGEATAAGG